MNVCLSNCVGMLLNLHVRTSTCAVSPRYCVFQLEQRALAEQLKVDEPKGPVGVGKNSPEAD